MAPIWRIIKQDIWLILEESIEWTINNEQWTLQIMDFYTLKNNNIVNFSEGLNWSISFQLGFLTKYNGKMGSWSQQLPCLLLR